MTAQTGGLKPVRVKTIPLSTDSDITAQSFLHRRVKETRDFNQDLDEGAFILLYPDGSELEKCQTFLTLTEILIKRTPKESDLAVTLIQRRTCKSTVFDHTPAASLRVGPTLVPLRRT
ncbi:hypothetical protein FQN60_011060 [Etheostoma spectabile]|uniref:Uncharacterized protein n=1 Tax=Etheostoma spectabile TaxID=54343 RepID=A0A5J5DR13_9PERO|nr:hypothetical protein FQN60_011060 [Etheostoma spectabile]